MYLYIQSSLKQRAEREASVDWPLINVGPLMADLGSLHDAQTAAALDNKQNMEQREQYYATVRKPLRSPIHEIGTLERIPGKNSLLLSLHISLYLFFILIILYVLFWSTFYSFIRTHHFHLVFFHVYRHYISIDRPTSEIIVNSRTTSFFFYKPRALRGSHLAIE